MSTMYLIRRGTSRRDGSYYRTPRPGHASPWVEKQGKASRWPYPPDALAKRFGGRVVVLRIAEPCSAHSLLLSPVPLASLLRCVEAQVWDLGACA